MLDLTADCGAGVLSSRGDIIGGFRIEAAAPADGLFPADVLSQVNEQGMIFVE